MMLAIHRERELIRELEKEKLRSRELFDNAPTGMCILGAGQVLLRVNRVICEMLGYTELELVGTTLANHTHPQHLTANIDLEKRFQGGQPGTYDVEKRCLRKDGTEIWVHVSAKPISDPERNTQLLFAVVQDISARKRADCEASKRERKLGAIMEVVPGCIKIVNAEGIITEISSTGASMLDAESADHIVGRRAQDFVSLPYREPFKQYARRVIDGHNGSFEFQAVTLKGRTLWLETRAIALRDQNLAFTGLLASTHDVSARKQNEEAQRKQIAAIESAMDGMALLDRDSKYVYLNSAHVKLFGYDDAAQLIGRTWCDLYSQDEIIRIEREVLPELTRTGHWEGEATGLRRDGTQFHEGLSVTLLEGGGMVCVCRDISEKKRAQEQLIASLEEKEALLQEVYHRVKNNLQVVSSLLNLQSGYVQDPATQKMLQDSQTRLRAMSLIHETLYRSKDLSQVDFVEYATKLIEYIVYANDLNSRSIALLANIAPVHLSVDTAVACGLILNELVSNCLKHAFPGKTSGTVKVALERWTESRLCLTVSDDGCGLPAGFNQKSLGSLGIRIVRTLCAQLSGEIKFITSSPGTFVRVVFGV